jgi:hypothetical protein
MVKNIFDVRKTRNVIDLTEDSDYYTSSYIQYFTWGPSFSNSSEKDINMENGVLYVMFKSNDSIYLYNNLDENVYEKLKNMCDPDYTTAGQSAGQYFANNIKTKYAVDERFDETEDYVVMVQA